MADPYARLQELLRDLFQFDCADLDFGIYRIMNHKRDVIERFVTQDLPKVVAAELERDALAEQSQAAQELQEVAAQIKDTLGRDALDADGNLAAAYRGTPLGNKYLALRSKFAGARGREAFATDIFNHLYAFFSRYYQDGDYVSKRRYSKRERYAIPYNGEEVYLYWANHDQYYVKTAEYFHDYTFTSGGAVVHFKIRAADVEQNNVKGEKRFFLPRPDEIAWDDVARQLVIPFEYRPLAEQENIAYGQKNQQEAILTEALERIPKCLSPKTAGPALAALMVERRKNAEGQSVTCLEHHLRQYTRRNTSDFFIHKDLKGFLYRELDFYLKNEVLNLDELEVAGEDRADGWFQTMSVIRAIGGQIIEFIDQIENFEKMLWEKRKFITQTQYCITVGHITEDFYSDIASCEPQWAEWKELFHIDEEKTDLFTAGKSKKARRLSFLSDHPTLVVDTKHFDQSFVDRLLASFDNLDEVTDGLLVHSENWQALNLLGKTYLGQIKCLYMDPPYNTDAGPILYKNDYKNSSWISMMADRIRLSRMLLKDAGILCATIDDYEQKELHFLLETEYGPESIGGTVTVRSNPSGRPVPSGFAQSHEYAIFVTKSAGATIYNLPRTEAQAARYRHRDLTSQRAYMWELFRKRGSDSERRYRPSLYYPVYIKGSSVRVPTMEWDDDRRIWIIQEKPKAGEVVVYPVDESGTERRWRGEPSGIQKHPDNYQAKVEDGKVTIYYKFSPRSEGVLPMTVWSDAKYSATEHGTGVLKQYFTQYNVFSYPKSIYAVEDCLRVSGLIGEADTACDIFAGSGTTGHAVINLNREDGVGRKFVLVEMADYFDTVLLPRVKKVTFTPEWKEGKPERTATAEEAERSPRIIKYMCLESYEDALNNIAFDDASGQTAMQFDDYLLRYMLKWETRGSETLLNVEKLARPFHYKLRIYADGQSHEGLVDVPETFNYLIGLHIQSRRVYGDDGRRYLTIRGRIDDRTVAVIWRETQGWQKTDFEQDKRFVAEQKLTDGADEVFVNGDSLIPNAQALEPIFKARMFAPVEA